jgi:hypothetical protein
MYYLCISARFKQAESCLVLCNLVHLFLQISQTQKQCTVTVVHAIWVAASYKQEVPSNSYKSLVILFLACIDCNSLICTAKDANLILCGRSSFFSSTAVDALNLCTSFLQNKEEDCRKVNNLLKYIG